MSTLTQPDADGNYSLLLLFQLAGWAVGEEPGDNLKLNLYVGDTNADGGFVIDRDSFIDADPMNAPKPLSMDRLTNAFFKVTPARLSCLCLFTRTRPVLQLERSQS